MMAQQLESGSPDKQALVTVLNYLKDRRLKDTEQALKRELGLEGATQMDTSASQAPQLPPIPQSDTEPAKYQDSYSRHTPTSSPSTATDLQSAQHRQSHDVETATREPLSSLVSDDDSEDEDEEEEDISDPFPPLQEDKLSVSRPGSHPIEVPTPYQAISSFSNQASLRAQPTTTTTSAMAPSTNSIAPLFSRNLPTLPLWAVGSSAFKPMSVTSSPSLSTPLSLSVSSTAPVSSSTLPPSVMYSAMLSSQGMGLHPQPLLTPLLTIVPSSALVTTAANLAAAAAAKSSPQQPLIIGGTPSKVPALVRTSSAPLPPPVVMPVPQESSGSPAVIPREEPSTGQTMLSPVDEQTQHRVLSQVPAQRTLASIPPSEMTPQYIELKAFAEEFKTKRIRLGYTQGSVGQSLARKGYSNFAQSTISRFEQMQLSATNAAAIKLVLEKWLQETEFPESVPQSSSDMPMIASRKRKKRAVFTPQTKSTLDEFFCQNPRPNRQAIESISQQLDLLPEEVRVWFCNKRQKQKQSSSSSTSSYYSAASPASSGFVSLRSPSLSPKRRSPSPKTSYTIEELSKSSNNGSSTPSPVLLTSPFSISPTTISLSSAGGRGSGVLPIIMPTTIPHMNITQTRA